MKMASDDTDLGAPKLQLVKIGGVGTPIEADGGEAFCRNFVVLLHYTISCI